MMKKLSTGIRNHEFTEKTRPGEPARSDEVVDESSVLNAIKKARLLIVDDEITNVHVLTDMLGEAGYESIQSTLNPHETLSLYRSYEPDLILLDLMMPGLDGMEVMEQLKAADNGRICCPILMLTADISPQTKQRALTRGAGDFLTKPFDMVELLLRIENLLENHFLYLGLQKQNETLEDRIRARTADLEIAQQRIERYAEELEEAHFETLERLARAGEFRDDDTGQHTQRVGEITAMLAEGLGFSARRIALIHQAARLHDVGKIGIPDAILLKPGKLTSEEFATMKTHATIGGALFENGQSELIQIAQRIALSHHERWDGSGYPEGLRGEEIPIEARLLAVVDVFDALTHNRPYKTAWPVAEAVTEIESQTGRQFDPQVVEVFLKLSHADLI